MNKQVKGLVFASMSEAERAELSKQARENIRQVLTQTARLERLAVPAAADAARAERDACKAGACFRRVSSILSRRPA